MARMRFRVGTRYLFKEQVYRVVQMLVNNQLLIENQSFGGQSTIAYDELVALWKAGELVFEVPSPIARHHSKKPLATEYTHESFSQLPKAWREEAWRRYQLLLPLLKRPEAERTRVNIQAYTATLNPTEQESATKSRGLGTAISPQSIERWLRLFEQSGYDLRALVPRFHRSSRKGESRLNAEVNDIIQQALTECSINRQHRTVDDVYLKVVNLIAEANRTRPKTEQLKHPHPKTVYRRIKAYDPSLIHRRLSRVEAQADATVTGGVTVSRILERVEIDHTLLDILLVDEEDGLVIGRPTLTFALDVYSGMPFGFYIGFEPPSYYTVASCLLHGILPKPDVCKLYDTAHQWPVYGLAETLIIDNAKELIGRDLEEACGQLGIILERMPVRTPWFKAAVERYFKTQNTGLLHLLPGTTFSNVLMKGDYNAGGEACLSLAAFLKILHIFLLDIYAQRWNSSKKAVPAKLWEEGMLSGILPSLHTSAEETRILLMRTETRVIQRSGIEFECLYYRNLELARLRSLLPKNERRVKIKFDPSDISTIYVIDPITGSSIPVPAANQEYTKGLSLWKHRIIKNFTLAEKNEVDIEGLAAAKAKIQKIVADEYINSRRNKGRKTAARYLDIGTSPVVGAISPDQPTLPVINHKDLPPIPQDPPQASVAADANPSASTATDLSAIFGEGLDLDMTGWSGDYNLLSNK
ncbi:Mu transposase C-terminal domain-containing protein [Herpetosiphon giganteus]|uniref:Mu transposase C-terminal domain-containing protein n=1 Tax=Herpetosiphon giganteus TaxID=2029754 RepID=UPI0019591C62|nr:Mu transposase C-terminal domain-containing protein [Herpetosiphon giganteus]MBM7842182.1 putative transposase [Herpetosiphon giganteus]